ncbi:MAG: dihydrolipoamide acetyltransferase family protein [Bacillota bacterium]|nr:dihydrolipoamide acetyltransferase family protein [Bacillota bacterium]
MLQDIVMPKLGLTMSEGTVARWIVSKGEPYRKGDPLFEAVTDKITFTVEAQGDGKIVEVAVSEGETVPVGTVVARAEVGGEATASEQAGGADGPGGEYERQRAQGHEAQDQQAQARGTAKLHGASASPGAGSEGAAPSGSRLEAPESAGEVVRASPAAKRLAREHNVDLAKVPGTGPGGRVVEGDVRAFLDAMLGAAADIIARATGERGVAEPLARPLGTAPSGTSVPYTAIGRTSAERTTLSFRTAPHFYISMDVDAAALLALRERILEDASRGETGETVRPSINDILVKVVARSLAENRYANASAADEGVVVYQEINIGVAVATEQGLVVPVVHNADRKTLLEIARETKELSGRAREGRLEPEDVAGGTFTISNLGMFGVDELCAIINPPQAAILGVGAVRERPVVKGGAVVAGLEMRLTLSADHRVLDGASAARFLGRVKEIVESLDPDVGV